MKKTVSIILTIILCLIMVLPNYIYANSGINPDDYNKIYQVNDANNGSIKTAGEKVLGFVQVIGVSAGVICLVVLGVKYMIMSSNANDKADIKEKLIPYIIGAVLLFSGTGLLGIVAKLAQSLGSK